jgi:hypothetical protein
MKKVVNTTGEQKKTQENTHRFDDGATLHDFLLVSLRTNTIQFTDNVGHASLVAHKGS